MARTFGVKVSTPLLQINTSTAAVVGQVWTATDTVGNGSWQTAAGGGGGLAASGTPTVGTYTKWASSTTLANSLVAEAGSIVTFSGGAFLSGTIAKLTSANSVALNVQNRITPDSGKDAHGAYFGIAVDATAITVANSFGIYIDAATKVSGTVTNAFGLYIVAPTIGSTSNTSAYINGNLVVNAGTISLTGTTTGRSSRTNSSTVDASGQGGSGNVLGTDDSGIVLKIISGQSAIFDNDGGIVLLPTTGTVTIPAIYGGQNPAITNIGGTTTGSNTVTLMAAEAIAAQGTLANATVTTLVGFDIGAMTGGATNNYGLRIAAPSGGATINRAIDVASGAFYVDGSGNVVTTGTITATGNFTSGSVTMTNQSDVVGLTVKGFSTQTNNLQIWETSTNTVVASISNAGLFTVSSLTTTGTFTTAALVLTNTSDVVGLTVKGFSTQTNMLQLWQTNTPTTVASLSNNGNMGLGATGTAAQMLLVAGTLAAVVSAGYGAQINPTIPLTTVNTTGVMLYTAGTINTTTTVNINTVAGIEISPITGSGGGTVTLSVLAGLYIPPQTAMTGISTITNAYGANISGPSTGTGRYGIFVAAGSTSGQALYAQNTASATVALATFDATATAAGQKITFDKSGHIAISQSAVPTIVASTGLGTVSVAIAVTAGSTDQSGSVTVTTTTAGTASATMFTVTFKNAYAVAPNSVTLSGGSAVTQSVITSCYVSSISTTTFVVSAGTNPFPLGAHKWFYKVE